MLLVDDVVLGPFKGLLWIAREIHAAVERASEEEADAIRQRLSELYMELETGRITEEDFDALEEELLDRLDAIEEGSDDVEI